MKNNPILPRRVKVGNSEHKRGKNVLEFYIGLAKSFIEFDGPIKSSNLSENNFKLFFKNGVFKKEYKEKMNIIREVSAAHRFGLLTKSKTNGEYFITKLCKKISEENSESIFLNFSYTRLVLVLYIAKFDINLPKERRPFFYGINLLKEKIEMLEKDFFENIFKLDSNLLKEKFENSTIDELKRFLVKNESGSSIREIYLHKKKVLFSLIDCYFDSSTENLETLCHDLIEFNKILVWHKRDFPRKIISLLKIDKSEVKNLYLKKKEEILLMLKSIKYSSLNKVTEFSNYFYCTDGSYNNLLKNYFIETSFFVSHSSKKGKTIKLNSLVLDLIDYILVDDEKIKSFDLKGGDIMSFFNDFIKENDLNKYDVLNDWKISQIIKEFYDDNFFKKLISKLTSNNYELNKNITLLGQKNAHISGRIQTPPLLFEYFMNIFFFKIFYKDEIRNNDNSLNKIFREAVGTKMSIDFVPEWYAPGGMSDSLFKDKLNNIYLIESTLEMRNQLKHELQSVLRHSIKNKAKAALLVSPSINNEFVNTLNSFSDKNVFIIPISKRILFKLLDKKNENFEYLINLINEFSIPINNSEIKKKVKDFKIDIYKPS